MHEEFESYRDELDRVRLTDESKKALAASLNRRKLPERPAIRSRRLTAGAGRIAAIAAVVCLLVTGAVATVVASPTLRDQVFGNSAGYSQSSTFIGKSVEHNGWTVTITDCVGDDLNLYVGLELMAPAGTVLDENSYDFNPSHYAELEFPGRLISSDGAVRQLPDDDPTDNRLNFMAVARGDWDFPIKTYNGQQMRLVLNGLYHPDYFDKTEQKWVYAQDCGATWDFGTMTVSYPDSTIHLEPNVTVTTLDVEAVITQIDVSPLSVYVRIEGDALKGHHSWVPKNAPDGWYGCMEYQEITLYDKGGNAYPVTHENSNLTHSGCSGGTDTSEDGYVVLRRTYGREDHWLVDVDSLTAISVCGVMIPLR